MSISEEVGFVLLTLFGVFMYFLYRLIRTFLGGGAVKEKKEGQGGSSKPFAKKEFFVKSLTRRRRLDLTRKGDNIMSGKLGKKLDRHRRGMFGK